MAEIVWDDVALAGWLDVVAEGVVGDLASEVAPRARQIAPVRSGRLKASVRWGIDRDALGVSAVVGAKWYGWFMEPHARQMHRDRPFLPTALFSVVNGRTIHLD